MKQQHECKAYRRCGAHGQHCSPVDVNKKKSKYRDAYVYNSPGFYF